jgi:hypothetical protein
MKKAVWLIGLCTLCAVIYVSVLAQGPPRPELAVAEFSTNNVDKIKADAISGMVETRISNTGKFRMITRDKIDELLKNQKIQASAISSDENIKKLGLKNVSYIATGTITAMDNSTYHIKINVIDVKNGVTFTEDGLMGSSSNELYAGVTVLVDKLNKKVYIKGDVIIANRDFNIGAVGPGGGIIFYDKGSSSDGWQYLEAAPVGHEFNAKWASKSKNVGNTRSGIGSGRHNTELIIEALNQSGENEIAAQLCANLKIGYFDKWFFYCHTEIISHFMNIFQRIY